MGTDESRLFGNGCRKRRVLIASEVQAIFCRRRHQSRRLPLADDALHHAQAPAVLDHSHLAARWWLRGTKKMPQLRGACRGKTLRWCSVV
jgi:hypothetical protein